MVRERWRNLNGNWQFAPAEHDDTPPIGKVLQGEILVPFPVESALSGVGDHHERLWYRRTFDIPADWTGDRVLLHFGAVDWETNVWVNGEHLGDHRGGYDAFTFDITDALVDEGPQEILVGVFDPTDQGTQPRGKQTLEPGGIWYTPTTGIWQSVWIEPVPQTSIRGLSIKPSLADGTVTIETETEGVARVSPTVEVLVDGRSIASGAGPSVTLALESPRAWSPEDPFLYDLRVTLQDESGNAIDGVQSYFGMRDVGLVRDEEGITRLALNGEPIFMMGLLDQGFWPDGLYTAPTDEALRYDIEVTKQLGYNTIRKHVKVEPARWYHWCDKLGVLVWQDMPSGDGSIGPDDPDMVRTPESAAQYQLELREMIEELRNHPSIVMWVPFNEGWGQFDTARITELVREIDPTRPVNSASGWTDRGTGDVHDVHAYPGPASPGPEPRRAAVLGEFGGLGLAVDGHTWTENAWGYRGVSDREELMRRYESLLRGVYDLKENRGLAAAIYTQTTDVETECNGLLTYDRAVLKVNPARLAAANRGELPTLAPLAPTARDGDAILWRYTFDEPTEAWTSLDFDDAAWAEGPAGFGREGTPGAVVRTPWHDEAIWLRRAFTLENVPEEEIRLLVHHDENAAVFLNGVLAAEFTGYTTGYEEASIRDAARDALRPGRNVLAVRCRQTRGGQYIDVGLVRLVPAERSERSDEP